MLATLIYIEVYTYTLKTQKSIEHIKCIKVIAFDLEQKLNIMAFIAKKESTIKYLIYICKYNNRQTDR